MPTKKINKMNKYCVICKKTWGPQMTKCCTSSSLVAIKKAGVFGRKKYYDLSGKELTEAEVIKLQSEKAHRPIAIQRKYQDKPYNATILLEHSKVLELKGGSSSLAISPIWMPVDRSVKAIIEDWEPLLVSVQLPKLMTGGKIFVVSCPKCGKKVPIRIGLGQYYQDSAVRASVRKSNFSIFEAVGLIVSIGWMVFAFIYGITHRSIIYVALSFLTIPIMSIPVLWSVIREDRLIGAAGIPVDRFKDREVSAVEDRNGLVVGQYCHRASIHSVNEESLSDNVAD